MDKDEDVGLQEEWKVEGWRSLQFIFYLFKDVTGICVSIIL